MGVPGQPERALSLTLGGNVVSRCRNREANAGKVRTVLGEGQC